MMRRFGYMSLAVLAMQMLWVNPADVVAGAGSTAAKRVEGMHVEQFGAYNALAEISEKAHFVIGVDAVLRPTISWDSATAQL